MNTKQAESLMSESNLGHLPSFPKVELGHTPTPLELLGNLSKQYEAATLYVKRDDCTGLAFGGNKVRQLEFYLGEALNQSADTILITGAVQSNFVRVAAAAACKFGLDCHIQLEERVPSNDPTYRSSGNVLLNHILGATIHIYAEGEDEFAADRQIRELADKLRLAGKRPYIIPLTPGHPPLGALGYIIAAKEIVEQLEAEELEIDEIFVASGSGSTHAGLLFGLRALGCSIPVSGVCVRRGADEQAPRILLRCQEIAELLQMEAVVTNEDVKVLDEFLAPGYGQLNPQALQAIEMAAQYEGLMLDPVYTSKTMAAMLDMAKSTDSEKSLLFIHTGGTPALFGYEPKLMEYLNA